MQTEETSGAGWIRDLVIDQKRFNELIRKRQVPGATLAVLVGDDLHTLASGVLNLDTGVDATPDSMFQLASITKVYTATVFMRLVERGLVSLDTPVTKVLPDFKVADPEVVRRVTMRHLLTHTSGIGGDFFAEPGAGTIASNVTWRRAPSWGRMSRSA